MNSIKISSYPMILRCAGFILPFLLWMFMFREFIFGRIPVNMDTSTIYSVTKFYFNNVLNGVVPLWDPFVLLGTPFYAITICNLFNPVTQLVGILKLVGFNYYDAFMAYVVVYFFLGAAGFYCLAYTVFQDRRAAYVAYVLFVFSGVGASIFNQFTILELCVPAVWFFVFFLRFARDFRLSDCVGLTFSAMILMISYLPFYFASLFLFFVILALIIYWKESLMFLRRLMAFVCTRPFVFLFCLLGFMISCAPLLVYKMINASQDVVSPTRHCNFVDQQKCYDRTLNSEGVMTYAETSQSGGLSERFHGNAIFTHLDKMSYGIDHFLYVPLFAVIVILLSCFVSLDRTRLLIALLVFMLFLLAMADVTLVHRFMYDHIFFFKYFRNMFMFEAYLIALGILFVVGQLKALWQMPAVSFFEKKVLIFWTVVFHAGMFVFLTGQDGIILTSFLTLAASFVFFVLLFAGLLKKESVLFLPVLVVIILLQPGEIFFHYSRNAREFQCELPSDHARARFSWQRPTQEIKSDCKIFQFVHYETFYDSMAMRDGRAVVGYPASVTRGAFRLSQILGDDALLRFAKNKLFLVDNLRVFSQDDSDLRALAPVFNETRNVAYVDRAESLAPEAKFNQEDWGQEAFASVLTEDSPTARVQAFDVNRLKLAISLSKDKFLIYTDSFTKHWQVLINGKPQKLLRVHGAFKGVQIPAGDSTVEFTYRPPGGGAVYVIVTVSLMLFLFWVCVACFREKSYPWEK